MIRPPCCSQLAGSPRPVAQKIKISISPSSSFINTKQPHLNCFFPNNQRWHTHPEAPLEAVEIAEDEEDSVVDLEDVVVVVIEGDEADFLAAVEEVSST